MPLDPSIPLSAKVPQAPDMIGSAMQAFTLKSAMMQSKVAEQQMADQQALKSVFADPSAFETDPNSGVPIPKPETMQKLYSISPTAAQKLGEATMRMRSEKQAQAERSMKMRQEYVNQAGPALASIATEYDQLAAKGDKDAAWAAVKPKVDAANAQFAPLAQQAGVPFKPITDADHLMQGAAQWSKYSESRLKATQPKTPHEVTMEQETARSHDIAEKRADIADKKFTAMQSQIAEKLKGDEDKKLEPDELNFMARQALRGDTSVFQNIGRGKQGAGNIAALRREIMKEARRQGIEPEQLAAINAEFQGLKAGERTLGTRTAQIEMAVNEAQNVIPIAINASEKVDRTRFPSLNAVLLAGEKGAGGEDVVKLATATNSLINIYARAISPTGQPTISDKEHARDILDKAYAKGQYKAAVDIMQQEIAAARKSPGQVRQSFRQAVTGQEGGAGGRPDSPEAGGKKKRPLSDFMGN